MENESTASARARELAELSPLNRALRVSYYLIFWCLPYRQLTAGARLWVRRFYIGVFGVFAAGYAFQGDSIGAVVMFFAMVLSAASLRLVDRGLQGGSPVPRTRWNLPADLEPPKSPEPRSH